MTLGVQGGVVWLGEQVSQSGVKIDVWVQPGVSRANPAEHTAVIYDPAKPQHKTAKVSLVLGAGASHDAIVWGVG